MAEESLLQSPHLMQVLAFDFTLLPLPELVGPYGVLVGVTSHQVNWGMLQVQNLGLTGRGSAKYCRQFWIYIIVL